MTQALSRSGDVGNLFMQINNLLVPIMQFGVLLLPIVLPKIFGSATYAYAWVYLSVAWAYSWITYNGFDTSSDNHGFQMYMKKLYRTSLGVSSTTYQSIYAGFSSFMAAFAGVVVIYLVAFNAPWGIKI